AELGIAHVAMADQLVSTRATDTRKNKVPNRVFQNRAVTDLEQVPDIGLVAAGARPGKRHVTNPARDFNQFFGGNLRIGLPGNAVVGQETIQLGVIDRLATKQIDRGLAKDAQLRCRVERGHESPCRNLDASRRRCRARSPRRRCAYVARTTLVSHRWAMERKPM